MPEVITKSGAVASHTGVFRPPALIKHMIGQTLVIAGHSGVFQLEGLQPQLDPAFDFSRRVAHGAEINTGAGQFAEQQERGQRRRGGGVTSTQRRSGVPASAR